MNEIFVDNDMLHFHVDPKKTASEPDRLVTGQTVLMGVDWLMRSNDCSAVEQTGVDWWHPGSQSEESAHHHSRTQLSREHFW